MNKTFRVIAGVVGALFAVIGILVGVSAVTAEGIAIGVLMAMVGAGLVVGSLLFWDFDEPHIPPPTPPRIQ